MTNPNKNTPSDNSDSSDSEDENINLVIDDKPKPKNPDKEDTNKNANKKRNLEEEPESPQVRNKIRKYLNVPPDEPNKKRVSEGYEKNNKKKRRVKFSEPKKNNSEPKGPIVINLFDLFNMEKGGWNQINYDEPPPGTDAEPPEEPYPEEDILAEPLETTYLNIPIRNIDDLIQIGNDYLDGIYSPLKKYNINVYTISKLVKPLTQLQKMIGMENVKQDVFELLLYQLQEFDNSKDMLHTIIEGEPGVGKTDLAKIMAEIYQEMGYCENKIIKFVKRSDLIGGYLGQTAIKTQKVLDECKGGILVIDEAYSLGSPEGRDSYSKECIDTLTSFLSESPDTIVFIMGYADDLEKSLFAHNKGLERRFSYRFTVKKYTPQDLRLILFKIIRQNGWDLEDESKIPLEFFEKNMDFFPFNGGDMLNLFTKCKFTHSIRFFNLNRTSTSEKNYEEFKKKINYEDLLNAFKLLKKDEKFQRRSEKNEVKNVGMYT